MSDSFTQEAPSVQYVYTQWDDTLQSVALRELGDASRWTDIALLNALSPPYIVNSPLDAGAGILMAGDMIAIPAPAGAGSNYTTDPDKVFMRGLRLDKGKLSAVNGRLAVVGGLDNLKQALLIRVMVPNKDLAFHPEFGCWVSQLIGYGNDPSVNAIAVFYVQSSLAADVRVQSVVSATATSTGDTIAIDAKAMAVSGRTIDITAVI